MILKSVSGIAKCDRSYYKGHQVLQSLEVITKYDVTEVFSVKELLSPPYHHINNPYIVNQFNSSLNKTLKNRLYTGCMTSCI